MAMIEVDNKEAAAVFDTAMGDAMDVHLFGARAKELSTPAMDDSEFIQALQSGDKQPLNPISLAREALGYDKDATVADIMHGLEAEYEKLVESYTQAGIDVVAALEAATNIITHTEAYITGYSRELGGFANRLVAANPEHKNTKRWMDKIWVPEEDMHDRTMAFLMYARNDANIEEFYKEHANHMQIGMHVAVENVFDTTTYLAQQEGATVPSYRHLGALVGPVFGTFTKAIGNQEARHSRLYSQVAGALMSHYPDQTVLALERQEKAFEMPGRLGIPNYSEKSALANVLGILDFVDILEVQRSFNTRLKISEMDFQSDEAKAAQDRLVDPQGEYGEDMLAKRKSLMEKLRVRAIRHAKKDGRDLPAILGVTVEADPSTGELSFPMAS